MRLLVAGQFLNNEAIMGVWKCVAFVGGSNLLRSGQKVDFPGEPPRLRVESMGDPW